MGKSGLKLVRIGQIVGVHGVRGWVKIFSDSKPRDGIFSYSPWLIGDPDDLQTVEVIDSGSRGKGLAAALKGVTDRETAAALMGKPIWIRREQLPALEQSYYWSDLEGLAVKNKDGQDFGVVSHLIETGANDVLVTKGEAGEILIPWLMGRSILSVDLDAQVIEVDWDPDY